RAIADEPGPAFLVDRDQSSFILSQSAPNIPTPVNDDNFVFTSEAEDITLVTKLTPAIANDGALTQENVCLDVEGITFDMIDSGDIDILLVDVEGAEYFVIKHLRSRPKIIVLETHYGNYRNPYMSEIDHWMATNDYARILCDES